MTTITDISESHLKFLDHLRASGRVNMFGAAPHLAAAFGMSQRDAEAIVHHWMDTFGERHHEKSAPVRVQSPGEVAVAAVSRLTSRAAIVIMGR